MPTVLSYEPTNFDAEDIPPDAPAGAWQATLTMKANKTQENLPRLICEWVLNASYDEANEGFVGSQVTDMITLKPGVDMMAKMNKLQLKALCERIGVSRQLIPKHILSSQDLEEFITACNGQVADIFTSVKVNDIGESRTRVHYTAPKNSLVGGVMGGAAVEGGEAVDAAAVEGDPEAEPEEAAFTGDEPEAVADAEEVPEPEPEAAPARRGRRPKDQALQAQQTLPQAPAPVTRQPAPATRPAPAPAAQTMARPAAMAPATRQVAPAPAANGAARRPIAAAQAPQRRA